MFGTRLGGQRTYRYEFDTAAQNIVTAVNRSGHLVGDTVLERVRRGKPFWVRIEELGCVVVEIGVNQHRNAWRVVRFGTRLLFSRC
jgi:hypothetical protein